MNLDIHGAVLAPGASALTGNTATISDNGKVLGTGPSTAAAMDRGPV